MRIDSGCDCGLRAISNIADHVQQRRAADSSEELSELPSSWSDCADVVSHLRERAAVGESNESGRHYEKNAALVRRSTVWAFRERRIARAKRHRSHRQMGGCGSA